jgi:hypothetical protein
MSMPGFTAEAALDRRSHAYRAAAGRGRLTPNLIRPAQADLFVGAATQFTGAVTGWEADRWCGLPTLRRIWTESGPLYTCVRYCSRPVYFGNGKVVWYDYTRPC